MKTSATVRSGKEPYRVMVVGDTIIGERGLVAIIFDDPRYRVCAAARTFAEANKLVRQGWDESLFGRPD